MTFNSLNFLVFFPLVVAFFYLLPSKFRWSYILIVSCGIYINISILYTLLLFFVTLITYFGTIWIDSENLEKNKYRILLTSIFLVISPLLFFKYYSVLNEYAFLVVKNLCYADQWRKLAKIYKA